MLRGVREAGVEEQCKHLEEETCLDNGNWGLGEDSYSISLYLYAPIYLASQDLIFGACHTVFESENIV
jgi:hypothetical protein